jgi:lipopolysaccharide heptosyltransferase II
MKILLIQTAFIGDVILATAVIEKLHIHFPHAQIDFLLKKGNESLLDNHPFVNKVLIFDKKRGKYKNIWQLVKSIRTESYDRVINLQRFFSSGLITVLSKGKIKTGFDKNPLSFFYNEKIRHEISKNAKNTHEVKRNLKLIEGFTDSKFIGPKLYPSTADFTKVKTAEPYITIAPASIWFTKQFPEERWIALIDVLQDKYLIYLLGGPADLKLCQRIQEKSQATKIQVKAGQLSFLESAALMKHAQMNYVNDSAPLHLASAMNAPVTAIFCSTVPQFGFGPLSDQSFIVETHHQLDCRPCGLHGKLACPKGHFKCADIEIKMLTTNN